MLATSSQVSIYCEGRLVEMHERIAAKDNLRSKSTKSHHLKPWEQEMQNGSLYRTKAQRLGPDVDRFVLALLNQGQGFIDTRKIWGILSLDKSYAPVQINEACKKALELDSLSYRMVKSLIKLMTVHPASTSSGVIAAPEDPGKQTTNKFVRPMSVYEEQLKLLH